MVIGEYLLKEKLITQEQLDKALNEQKQSGGLLGIILVMQGVLTEKQLVNILQETSKAARN
jgi:hypothetical protein